MKFPEGIYSRNVLVGVPVGPSQSAVAVADVMGAVTEVSLAE